MASINWVNDLFPPRFKLSTAFDCDETKSETAYLSRLQNVQKIYEDVYSTTVPTRKAQEFNTNLKLFVVKPKELVERGRDSGEAESSYIEKKVERDVEKPKCIWNAGELKVLRDSFKRSRLNNIRLNVLTRSLQKDCEHLRNICREQAREVLQWNKKFNDVKKQNKRMKITCKAFKEDARKWSADLEECQGLLQVATSDRDRETAELELVQSKKELEVVQKQCKTLRIELDKQKLLQDRLLRNQKVAIELLQAREIHGLSAKLQETRLKLEKEKNDHAINKKALEHLRLHFASGRA